MVMMETDDRDFGASGNTTTQYPTGWSQTASGLGPFNAKVWDFIGSFDAWGLPKVSMYETTLQNGRPAVAMNIGGEWHVWESKSSSTIRAMFEKMRSLYSWTNIK